MAEHIVGTTEQRVRLSIYDGSAQAVLGLYLRRFVFWLLFVFVAFLTSIFALCSAEL